VRVESASVAKGRRAAPTQLKPRDGTRIRAIYDLLQANKGLPIEVHLTKMCISKSGNISRAINDLSDYYGLDIRRIGGRYGRWVLAGEWFGRTYVDYIADRIHAADRRAAE
jgi:hypothetical protein